jgi:hypothetical protein
LRRCEFRDDGGFGRGRDRFGGDGRFDVGNLGRRLGGGCRRRRDGDGRLAAGR